MPHLLKTIESRNTYVAIIILVGIMVMATIIRFMPMDFTSDSAFYLLLAREQIGSGQMFPPGMCYSTALFVITPNLVIIPFLFFLSDWILARSLGLCVVWALLLFAVVKTFVAKGDANWRTAAIACALVGMPLFGSDAVRQLFLEGGYLSYCVSIVVCLAIAHYIITNYQRLESSLHGVGNKRSVVLLLIGVFLAVVLPSLGEMRGILQSALPFFLAFPLLWACEKKSLDGMASGRLGKVLLVVWVAGILCANVGRNMLYEAFWPVDNQMEFNLDSSATLADNVLLYIEGLYALYGQQYSTELMSTASAIKMIYYLYGTVCIFVFPIWSLVRLRSIRGRLSRYVVIFAWVSNVLLFAITVTTGALSMSARYLIPTYFTNCFLAAVCINEMMLRRTRFERGLIAFVVASLVVVSTWFYWKASTPSLKSDTSHQDIVAFLKENDLEYGYATFWNSYANTCFANGDVEIVAFSDRLNGAIGDPTQRFLWLTNERYFDVSYHPGRCFILLEEGERVEDKWYELASKQLTHNGYTVLVFDKNINLYET